MLGVKRDLHLPVQELLGKALPRKNCCSRSDGATPALDRPLQGADPVDRTDHRTHAEEHAWERWDTKEAAFGHEAKRWSGMKRVARMQRVAIEAGSYRSKNEGLCANPAGGVEAECQIFRMGSVDDQKQAAAHVAH